MPGYYADAATAAKSGPCRARRCSCTRTTSSRWWPARARSAWSCPEQCPGADTVIVAVGGGGLVAGVAAWYANDARVVGVEPERSPTMSAALAAGRPVDVEVGGVAADSLGARRAGDLAHEICDRFLHRMVTVPDEAIVDAQRRLWHDVHLVAEPGAAAALAALLCGAYDPSPMSAWWSSCAAPTPTRPRRLTPYGDPVSTTPTPAPRRPRSPRSPIRSGSPLVVPVVGSTFHSFPSAPPTDRDPSPGRHRGRLAAHPDRPLRLDLCEDPARRVQRPQGAALIEDQIAGVRRELDRPIRLHRPCVEPRDDAGSSDRASTPRGSSAAIASIAPVCTRRSSPDAASTRISLPSEVPIQTCPPAAAQELRRDGNLVRWSSEREHRLGLVAPRVHLEERLLRQGPDRTALDRDAVGGGGRLIGEVDRILVVPVQRVEVHEFLVLHDPHRAQPGRHRVVDVDELRIERQRHDLLRLPPLADRSRHRPQRHGSSSGAGPGGRGRPRRSCLRDVGAPAEHDPGTERQRHDARCDAEPPA